MSLTPAAGRPARPRARIARALAIVLAAIALAACASRPAARAPGDAAHRFVAALNAGDTAAMRAASALPFHLREQQWASATDGAGMVLGAVTYVEARDAAGLAALFAGLAGRVRIARPEGTADAPGDTALLAGPLRGARGDWPSLHRFVFLRGMGDVEHIAIVGVSPATGRVVALYLN